MTAVPRAAGVRKRYADVPVPVRAWVEEVLGSPVVEVEEQAGGMSPGCATRVRGADGSRAFVKAVGPELNPLTPGLFRHEAMVLDRLGANPLWAPLLAAYDEPGGWVALMLADVPGVNPDPRNREHRDLMLEVTRLLGQELTGRAAGWNIASIAAGIERWAGVWPTLDSRRSDVLPEEVLPRWAKGLLPSMQDRLPALIDAARGEYLVHNDLRNDNLILGTDGSLTVVDWGMARRGAAWADPLVLLLEWVDQDAFDDLVHASPALVRLGDELVTTFLFTLAVWLADRSVTATDAGLPTLKTFRRRESERVLAGVHRRVARDLGRSLPR